MIIDIPASVLAAIHRLSIEAALSVELYAQQLIGEAVTASDAGSMQDAPIAGEMSGEPQIFDRQAFRQKMNVMHRVQLGRRTTPDVVITEIPGSIIVALNQDAKETGLSVEEYAKNLIAEAVSRHVAKMDRSQDPLAAARARGVKRFAEMLSREDMWVAEKIAVVLSLSAQQVDELRLAHKMLGITGPTGETKYPRWQVDSNDTIIDGLDEALAILGDNGATAYRILCEIFPDGRDNTHWQCLQDGRKTDVLKRLQAIARGDFV